MMTGWWAERKSLVIGKVARACVENYICTNLTHKSPSGCINAEIYSGFPHFHLLARSPFALQSTEPVRGEHRKKVRSFCRDLMAKGFKPKRCDF